MGWSGIVFAVVPIGALVAFFARLARSRQRVMGYHDIPTPSVRHGTHGSGHGD